jgi:hypothetical protein
MLTNPANGQPFSYDAAGNITYDGGQVILSDAYPDGNNPIDYRVEQSVDEMVSDINDILRISWECWTPLNSIPEIIETNLRAGYWTHVDACFDYKHGEL